MTDLLYAEKLKTADALIVATVCIASLRKCLDTCSTSNERRRVQRMLKKYETEARRLGDRVLRLQVTVETASTIFS